LGLDGTLRGVSGIVPLLDAMQASEIVLPMECIVTPDDLELVKYRGVSSLSELIMALEGRAPWPDQPEFGGSTESTTLLDLADVVGQPVPRIAVELAAAGRHHLLLVGPPGAGKTLLASRLPGILPGLDPRESREVARIYSPAGVARSLRSVSPPFRAPHHGASTVSLVGGGTSLMRPGEISLACHGVLFLDELGEFSVTALESLRQPLETGSINISRASATATLPADFLLVAAMNPCPCGQDGAPGDCRCSDAARQRYSRRLSGPLMDRFDLRVIVGRADPVQLLSPPNGEKSASVLERVEGARRRAKERGVRANAELNPRSLEEHSTIGPGANDLLERLLSKNDLTARGLHRVKTVALTMADLSDEAPVLTRENLVLATSLRAPVAQLMGGS
ncbi:MAG: YifB family Mg chelatase-like AAA ATPase, partial [Acidimicrobiales bacterium]